MNVADGIVHQRQQREQVLAGQVAGDQRHQPDQNERGHAGRAQDLLRIGRTRRAVVLQGKSQQQEGCTDQRDRVDPQRQAVADELEVHQRDGPGVDRGSGREQAGHDVARRKAGAQRQHGRPGQPVAPHGNRRDEFRIRQPGSRAIDRGTARLVGIEAGNLGIDEALHEPHQDRVDPHHPAGLADHCGDPAHGQQHAGGHARTGPERPLPVERAMQLALRRVDQVTGLGEGDVVVFGDHRWLVSQSGWTK